MNAYPPSPWRLKAHAYVGIYLLPAALLPAPHSPATRPITFYGRGIACAAFFVYEEPSPLTYNEIMSTVLVRKGWRPLVSITRIWVDSEASRDGGRALWAIPKELAAFVVHPHSSYAASEGAVSEGAVSEGEKTIGSLDVYGAKMVPVRVPVRFSVAQDRDGEPLITAVRGRGRPGIAKAHWAFTPEGPMGHLADRKALVTLVLRPLRIVFGD